MPELKHQAIVQILHDEPQLVAMLLGHSGFIIPRGGQRAAHDLGARGMSGLDQVRARISACTDPDQLEGWIIRAATATTLEEVFAA